MIGSWEVNLHFPFRIAIQVWNVHIVQISSLSSLLSVGKLNKKKTQKNFRKPRETQENLEKAGQPWDQNLEKKKRIFL